MFLGKLLCRTRGGYSWSHSVSVCRHETSPSGQQTEQFCLTALTLKDPLLAGTTFLIRAFHKFCGLGTRCYPSDLISDSVWLKHVEHGARTITYVSSSRKKRIVREKADEIQQVIEENSDKIDRFASFLNCSFKEMKELVEKDTRIVTSMAEDRVLDTITYLKQYGFTASEILSNPPAFCLSRQSLLSRLKKMEEVRCRKIYILKFGPKKFKEILRYYEQEKKVMKGFVSRETYLAALFRCDETDVYKMAEKYPYIETYSVCRLTDAFNVLRGYGFKCEDVRSDPLTLFPSPEELQRRLDLMNSVGLLSKDQVFPLLHVRERSQFDNAVLGWAEDQAVLAGFTDKTSYISSRLHCSVADVENLCKKSAMLRHCRPRRWKAVLDVLLDEMNLPPDTILSHATMMTYSTKRMRSRYEVCIKNGVTDPNRIASLMFLSKKKFTAIYGSGEEKDIE